MDNPYAYGKGGVKITILNRQKKVPVNHRIIKKAILNILSKEKIRKSGEITVSFVNDSAIARLNKKYSKKNKATDVLSFDLTDKNCPKHLLADIVVSADTAIRNSGSFKTTPEYELSLYVVHGILHLAGFGDSTPKERILMLRKEKEYVYRKN